MVRDRVLTASLESVFWNTVNVGTGIILILAAGSMSDGTLGVGDFAVFVYFLDFVTDATYFIGLFIARLRQAGVSFERMLDLMRGLEVNELVRRHDLRLTGPYELPQPPARTAADRLNASTWTHCRSTTPVPITESRTFRSRWNVDRSRW